MDPSALHCAEKPSVHANTPFPDILQKLEESRLRLLNPVCPSGLWKDVGETHVESFWKGQEGSTKSDNVPETREISGRNQNQEQSKLMLSQFLQTGPKKLLSYCTFSQPNLLRLENPFLTQQTSSSLILSELEESRARLLLPVVPANVPLDSAKLLKGSSLPPWPKLYAPELPRQEETSQSYHELEEHQKKEDEVDSFNDIPEYVLAMPENELEQLQEEDNTLLSEIQEEDEGVAVKDQKLMLLSMVCCSLVEGARFGNPPGLLQQKLMKICKSLAEYEPEFILKVALYARQELNIRSMANFLLALASYLQPCRPHVRRYFCHAVQLPSDWMQVARLYQSLAGEEGKLAPMPSCLRAGMADKFRQFDAYQLAKYNTRRSRGKQCHKPKATKIERPASWDNWKKHRLGRNQAFASKCEALQKMRQENMESVKKKAARDLFSLKNLIHRLHISEPAQQVMSILGRRYPPDLPSFSRSRLPGPWDPTLAGTRMRLPVPQTWDRELSNRGNKAAVWEELIDSKKLPFMAMLRNLRNILRSGVSERHHQFLLKRLEDKDTVIHSRQLPFRFLSAYKVILDLEKEFNKKDEPFPSNVQLIEKVTKLMKLPMNFRKPRHLRGCMEIPLIFQMVKQEKKKLLKSRDIRYTSDLLQRYCQALETAVGLSVKHNMHPIPGRTLILISSGFQLGKPCVQAKNMYCPTYDKTNCIDLKNPMTVRDLAMLLGSMLYSVCEQANVFLCNFSNIVGAIPMTGSVLKDVQTLQNVYQTVYYSDDWSASDVIKDFLIRREHVDTILLLSSNVEELNGSCLQFYRQHVSPDCLFINICAEPGEKRTFKSRKDVVIHGFNEQMFRFMSECGNSRFLEHVGKVDEIHGLPKQQRTATAQQEPGVVSLIPVPQSRWRSVRIFVSSTFRDMHGERDLLIRSVFPELRARAARFCLAIQEIDLRWGITEQESQRNKQVELCLSEVSRSDLFIGILGERYGNVPKETSLPEEPQYEWVKTYPLGRSITELEAVQFLNGSHDPTAESRAFFYLREPDFLGSVPEPWKKDFGAESEEASQHMTDLKEHLRKHGSLAAFSSYACQWGGVAQGQPFVKGLEDFGHRVLQDVWKCLQHHFIEGGESELTIGSKEEEGNTLQESFQESQQRRFCARTKLLNTTAAQMRSGKLYVVSGEPGQGKTVFLAALAEKLRKMVPLVGEGPPPKYHVVAHFTKAGPNQTKAQVVLDQLCSLLRKLLENPPTPPRSYRGLVTQFECLLHAVAKLLKRRQCLVLLIDGADLIHAAGGELVSDWLPENMPQRVSLVLSVSSDSMLRESLKQRKDAVFIPLEPLAPPDRASIVRKDLALHGKKLEESAFNNQMRLVLLKRGSRQPLYLSLLIQDLRLFALYEKLSERIQKLPISLPLMMQHLLGCMEQDHGLELVAMTLVSLWASRDGLMEQDLYSVLSMWKELNGTTVTLEKAINAGRHVGNFPTALFFDLLRSLRGLLGACGSPSELPGSRLQLCGTPLRMAVERRYVKKPGLEHTAQVFLAAHWWKLSDPDGSRTFQKSDAEALTALPYHLVQSGYLDVLASFLTDLKVISAHLHLGHLRSLSEAYALYATAAGSEPSEAVNLFSDFLQRNFGLLSQNPLLLLQQAANEPSSSDLCLQAQVALQKCRKPFLKWINKPERAQQTRSLVLNLPSTPSSVSLAPSGKLAIVGTVEGTLHLVEMKTGQEQKSLLTSCDGISACAFLSETTVCLGAFNGRFELWSLREGCRILSKDAHKAQITDCCINSDCKLLASVSLDGTLKLWEAAQGHVLHQWDFSCPLNCVTFHPNGQFVAIGGWDRSVTVLDTNGMSKISVMKDHDASIHCISFSSTGKVLAAATLAGSITLWSWQEAIILGSFKAHSGCTSVARFLSDEKLLTAGEDCKVQICKGHLGQFWSTLGSRTLSPALCMASNLDGSQLAVGHHSDGIWIYSQPWRFQTTPIHLQGSDVAVCSLVWLHHIFLVAGLGDGSLRVWKTFESSSDCCHHFKAHEKAVMGLGVSDKLVASVSDDFTVGLWLSETLRPGLALDAGISPLSILRGHTSGVTCCAFSLDGNYLATGSKDRALFLWDVRDPLRKTPSLLRSLLFCHQDWISSCAWIGTMLLSGSNDGTVCLWDTTTSECVQKFLGHQSPICGITTEKDHVISMGRDGLLITWNLQGVEETRFLAHPSQTNHCIGFRDPWQKDFMLAAAGADGTVKIWRPLTIEQPQVLFGHSASVCAAAATSSSFLTISKDKSARIWAVPKNDADTEQLPPHQGAVTAVAWSPDGNLAASGGEHGDLIVWQGGELLGMAKVGPQCISALTFHSSHTILVACDGISLWDISDSMQKVKAVSLTRRRILWQNKGVSVLCMGTLPTLGASVCGLSDGDLLVLQPGDDNFQKFRDMFPCCYIDNSAFDVTPSDEEEETLHVWHTMEKPGLMKMKLSENKKATIIKHIKWTPEKPSSFVTVARLVKDKLLLYGDTEGFLWSQTAQIEEEEEEETEDQDEDEEKEEEEKEVEKEEEVEEEVEKEEEEEDASKDWQKRKIHCDKITALHLVGDRIITASCDRDVKIWDGSTMKLIGQFRCRAQVSCLQPFPRKDSSVLLMVGDTLGTVYFLDWDGLCA
ncbi:telomerase protein component 1 isoform X2 [Pantherophis guttatus]|uniref:Telomerase protein component 1 isoform X2 n=1 Tax=Pantherophis guttatus TaxID=94885 RepID=A0ABM3ZF37_PANGU|nr:telomerase protein component 1 isoform X2 [Pantherophis guttatus]